MKRLVLVACVLLSGTAHAEVPKPVPLSEMFENRLAKTDEIAALKMLPSLRDVRKNWVKSYEGWQERLERQEQAETLDTVETESLDTPTYSGDIYDQLAMCESGMNPATNTGNGYYGAFQFLPSTWTSLGYSGLPTDHSYAVQKQAAIALIARSGWGQFPGCAAQLGML